MNQNINESIKQSLILVPFVIVFFMFYIGFYFLNQNFSWNIIPKDLIEISATLTFGFSVALFSYTEYSRKEKEEEPNLAFDISTNSPLISGMGDIKSPSFHITGTENIFLVIKNVGTHSIYNLHVKLRGDYEANQTSTGLREISIPTLLPGEYKLFNTGITVEGLNGTNNAFCEAICRDFHFKKEYSFKYDLIKNKDYIVNYIKEFSQENELQAIHNYKEILNLRSGTSYEITKILDDIRRTLEELRAKFITERQTFLGILRKISQFTPSLPSTRTGTFSAPR